MSLDGPEPTNSPKNGDKGLEPNESPESRVQILGFHTVNPIISYQNQIYSCEWTSTLGTDVLLSTPDPKFQHPVLRENPGVSVIAATRIKLFGRPIQLTSRSGTNGEEPDSQEQTPAPEAMTQTCSTLVSDQPARVTIPVGKTPTLARHNQANFLERLIAIKVAKGETDKVTVHTQKANQGSGWRSQHKALEDQRGSDDVAEGTPPARSRGGRPRGKPGRPRKDAWKRLGPKTQKGGLFRDYRPQLWDTEGADIRGTSSATPETWDQLEGAGDGSCLPQVGEKKSLIVNLKYSPRQARGDERRVTFVDEASNSSNTPGFQPRRTDTPSEASVAPSGIDGNTQSLIVTLGYKPRQRNGEGKSESFADQAASSSTGPGLQLQRDDPASRPMTHDAANAALDQQLAGPMATEAMAPARFVEEHVAGTEGGQRMVAEGDVEMRDV